MKILLFIIFFNLIVIDCVNPPRSNKFDPANSNKASLEGHTYMYDNSPLSSVIVSLILDSIETEVDISDSAGNFEFEHINPGIYEVRAEAKYFASIVFYPESLSAGAQFNDFNIYFYTFDFEDDTPGDPSPYGFRPVSGSWLISKDS